MLIVLGHTKDYSEQLEFLNSQPYYASKKTVNQSSDFPVRRTGSYRHKKSTAYAELKLNVVGLLFQFVISEQYLTLFIRVFIIWSSIVNSWRHFAASWGVSVCCYLLQLRVLLPDHWNCLMSSCNWATVCLPRCLPTRSVQVVRTHKHSQDFCCVVHSYVVSISGWRTKAVSYTHLTLPTKRIV